MFQEKKDTCTNNIDTLNRLLKSGLLTERETEKANLLKAHFEKKQRFEQVAV